jgi:hypothetical protein
MMNFSQMERLGKYPFKVMIAQVSKLRNRQVIAAWPVELKPWIVTVNPRPMRSEKPFVTTRFVKKELRIEVEYFVVESQNECSAALCTLKMIITCLVT